VTTFFEKKRPILENLPFFSKIQNFFLKIAQGSNLVLIRPWLNRRHKITSLSPVRDSFDK